MLPEVKVYKIDYEFIVSNYLDKKLWQKQWNLFIYKKHIFTLNLLRIETKDNVIVFEIRKNNYWSSEWVHYNINNTSIKILIQQINGAIFRLMCSYEISIIKETEGYNNILEAREQEEEKLREIAKNFLDENQVSNEDIRKVYIDNYISRNTKIDIQLQNYVDYYKYNYCTDMLITFCKITGDKNRLDTIKNASHNISKLNNIELTVDEFIKELESEEYNDRLSEELPTL